MNYALETRIRFLRTHGAGAMQHSGSNLLEHLLGTYTILRGWNAREALCDAGLFHSVYGTESYQETAIPLKLREQTREIIGEEAEELAYFFGMMQRKVFRENFELESDFRIRHRISGEQIPITHRQFRDLVDIEVANGLEMVRRLPKEEQKRGEYLALYRSAAMTEARLDIDKFMGGIRRA